MVTTRVTVNSFIPYASTLRIRNTSELKIRFDSVLLSRLVNIQNLDHEADTVRVRIWRALSTHTELSMKQLSMIVGERSMGNLKSHLGHVEKQAKSFQSKSKEWKERRGLLEIAKRGKIIKRKGAKGIVYIRLE